MKRLLMCWAIVSLGVVGCGDDDVVEAPTESCTPDKAVWDAEIARLTNKYCGDCHGVSTNFGAPFSLDSYDAFLTTTRNTPRHALVSTALENGTMPPSSSPRVPKEDVEKIIAWSSCGTKTAPNQGGLTVDRSPLRAPKNAPKGLETLDLLAPSWPVKTSDHDLYQCFTFEAPSDPKLVRRIEMVIDDQRVVHHAVLLRDSEKAAPTDPHECYDMPRGSDYLYAWAPGTEPIQFPDGGLRIDPGERYVMQIHYNNSAMHEDVVDSSGVRLFLDEVGATEYGMFAVGPLTFGVPARSKKDVQSACTITTKTTVFASLPHMHEIGAAFSQTVTRADKSTSSVVNLSNWDFETQLFYDTPMELQVGDVLKTTCSFDNPTSSTVSSGFRTRDEMCFNFMYVSPPPQKRYCDESLGSGGGETCESPHDLSATTKYDGHFVFGTVPEVTKQLNNGNFSIDAVTVYRESGSTPVGSFTEEHSQLQVLGRVQVEGSQVSLGSVLDLDLRNESGRLLNTSLALHFDGVDLDNFSPPTCNGASISTVSIGDINGHYSLRMTTTDPLGQTLTVDYQLKPME